MKDTKGITLIALIITIIILLIFAWVTINVLIGDNGLFKIAQNIEEKYQVDIRINNGYPILKWQLESTSIK